MSDLHELDLILRRVAGKGLADIVEDVVSCKPESEIVREVAEFARRERDKEDTFKNAVEELRKTSEEEL